MKVIMTLEEAKDPWNYIRIEKTEWTLDIPVLHGEL